MRDANGSRFALVLGRADWGRCKAPEAEVLLPLAELWDAPVPRGALRFDEAQQSLMLAERVERFRAPPGDSPAVAARRLGADSDRFGNIYWVADGGARIDVLGGGSRTPSLFWQAQPEPAPGGEGDFAPLQPAPAGAAPVLRGLVVTGQHYLVAGVRPTAKGPGGLRVFDLLGGGGPVALRWPAAWPFEPHDLAERPCGGVAVLDRTHKRVWLLDRRLGMHAIFPVEAKPETAQDVFRAHPAAPVATPAPAPAQAARQPWFDLVRDGDGGDDPVALDVLPDGAIVVVDAEGSDGHALVSVYRDGRLVGRASADAVNDVLRRGEQRLVLRAHDAALTPPPPKEKKKDQENREQLLVIASDEGNQCFAFGFAWDAQGKLALKPERWLLPMRRFGSKDLVRGAPADAARLAEDTGLRYDGLGLWLPLVRERRPRYEAEGQLQTWAFDSEEPACTWNRVVVDGCVPPGTRLRIASRAAEEEAQLADQPWCEEPRPVLRTDGSELPWLLDGPTTDTDAARGRGAWELLLQAARGRYLQLRVTLESEDLLATPRLFALRAWSPRFSYAQRYLPAVYREDEASADFLDRFLANFEGVYTALEDRIASATALFDVRSAPAETLDWLAGWLGLVMDPAVDAQRKRQLIRFAVPLFKYRGTTQGLRLATELVLSPCVPPEAFALPLRSQQQPYGIRVIERFLTRRLPRGVAGDTVVEGPRRLPEGRRWTTADGVQKLQQRYREALRAAKVENAASATFEAAAPADGAQAWRDFTARELGFTPRLAEALRAQWQPYRDSLPEARRNGLGAALPRHWPDDAAARDTWREFLALRLSPDVRRWLARWQGFLARRYHRVDAFAEVWGMRWPAFALVPAPDVLPSHPDALADWALFEGRLEAMEQAAHRFSVLVPADGPNTDAGALLRRMQWAQRVVRLEKPAHTVFDVRPYWAMFRVGHARAGIDTVLGESSRAASLAPALVVGQGHVGASRVALAPHVPRDRLLLQC